MFMIFAFIGFPKVVEGKEAQIYYGERLEGISYVKIKGAEEFHKNTIIQRRSSNGSPVYCLEAFKTSEENYDYTLSSDFNEIKKYFGEDKILRAIAIAYYGYGYKDHQDPKWYSVTQIHIWRTLDPNNTFAWTTHLGGSITSPFAEEEAELNRLVERHFKKPSFFGKEIVEVKGHKIVEEDTNKVLEDYEVEWGTLSAKVEGNNLVINPKGIGQHLVKLKRKLNPNLGKTVYFLDSTHQKLMTRGNYIEETEYLRVEYLNTSLTIIKKDIDTKDIKGQGKASLTGAVYQIKKDGKVYDEVTIGEDSSVKLIDLPFGKYEIKEIASGNGYLLNNEVYEVEISPDNLDQELVVYNKVIENEIEITKYYGDDISKEKEAGISFKIYDLEGNFIKEVTTDDKGKALFTLTFGKYKIIQVNTLEGYYLSEEIELEVYKEGEELKLEIINLKIPTEKAPANKGKIKERKTNENTSTLAIKIPNAGIGKTIYYENYIYKKEEDNI